MDVCAINKTGPTGEEYVEVEKGLQWIGSNQETEEERGGGVGFIIKEGVETEVVKKQEDLLAIEL